MIVSPGEKVSSFDGRWAVVMVPKARASSVQCVVARQATCISCSCVLHELGDRRDAAWIIVYSCGQKTKDKLEVHIAWEGE